MMALPQQQTRANLPAPHSDAAMQFQVDTVPVLTQTLSPPALSPLMMAQMRRLASPQVPPCAPQLLGLQVPPAGQHRRPRSTLA